MGRDSAGQKHVGELLMRWQIQALGTLHTAQVETLVWVLQDSSDLLIFAGGTAKITAGRRRAGPESTEASSGCIEAGIITECITVVGLTVSIQEAAQATQQQKSLKDALEVGYTSSQAHWWRGLTW